MHYVFVQLLVDGDREGKYVRQNDGRNPSCPVPVVALDMCIQVQQRRLAIEAFPPWQDEH